MKIFWRSLAFNIAFFGWSLLASLAFFPLLFSESAHRAGRPWAQGVLWLARHILGLTYEIRGQQHITYLPVVYASKHQSAWDTVIFLCLFARPAYVLKRELLHIPFWGWYLRAMGMIAIDRSGKGAAMRRMLHGAKEALQGGRPIVIFPEGTRTAPGAPPAYQPGIAALYRQLHVPVVPVALNSGRYWGKSAFIKHPGKIVMEFLPPIEPGLKREEFVPRLEHAIETASQKLLQEAKV